MAYFISTVRYNKTMDNGQVKTVNEQYLVDSLTVTEAEARTTEFVQPYISGEFSIPSVKNSRIAEIFSGDGEYWWLVKVAFISIDEKTAQEKKSISQILVQADDFSSACEKFADGMKNTMADWELQSVSLSKIVDYIAFSS